MPIYQTAYCRNAIELVMILILISLRKKLSILGITMILVMNLRKEKKCMRILLNYNLAAT